MNNNNNHNSNMLTYWLLVCHVFTYALPEKRTITADSDKVMNFIFFKTSFLILSSSLPPCLPLPFSLSLFLSPSIPPYLTLSLSLPPSLPLSLPLPPPLSLSLSLSLPPSLPHSLCVSPSLPPSLSLSLSPPPHLSPSLPSIPPKAISHSTLCQTYFVPKWTGTGHRQRFSWYSPWHRACQDCTHT